MWSAKKKSRRLVGGQALLELSYPLSYPSTYACYYNIACSAFPFPWSGVVFNWGRTRGVVLP